jgi:6-pyruvoyltetrahydropterin/6-carboxytetrahydropterin synthase
MITITRTLEFDSAHRVMNHESKCATLHGHRYKVEIVATCSNLDHLGRVVDFSVVKRKIGTWLDKYWDHTTILFKNDKTTIKHVKACPSYKPVYVTDWNPTAENMATFLLDLSNQLLKKDNVTVIKVIVHETPNCKAEASRENI